MIMNEGWITTSASSLLMVLVSAIGVYLALLLFTRLAGLRSFSKMSSFDFAITIAFGSVIASTLLSKTPALFTGIFALAVLYGIQYAVSRSRRMFPAVEKLVDNEPLLLMVGHDVLAENLDTGRMTVGDIKSKLRMAGVTHRDEVLAVVMESTGDVAVIRHGDPIDPWLFEDIRGADKITAARRTAS